MNSMLCANAGEILYNKENMGILLVSKLNGCFNTLDLHLFIAVDECRKNIEQGDLVIFPLSNSISALTH